MAISAGMESRAAAVPTAPGSARAPPPRRSVAVLPFRSLSADPENEFFADGITEDLIAQLSKMRALKVISRTSAFPNGHATLGWAHMLKGDAADGIEELRKAVSSSPGNTVFLAQLGEALGLAGRRQEALDILAQLERLARERYVMPYHFAYICTGLGQDDEAMDVLERAAEERAGGIYGIKGSFLFTTLRRHPRFKALLRRMNLDDEFRSRGARFPPTPSASVPASGQSR